MGNKAIDLAHAASEAVFESFAEIYELYENGKQTQSGAVISATNVLEVMHAAELKRHKECLEQIEKMKAALSQVQASANKVTGSMQEIVGVVADPPVLQEVPKKHAA